MIIALLCVALGISTLTPMDDTNAATIVYTRKKTYILSDSEKIKRFTCNAIKRNYNPALKKVSVTFTDEGKYTIKYVTGKNKKKTCVVYIDSKKPVISGVKNGEDYESKVSIKVSDKVSGVASVTLNGEKMGNKFTVSEAGDYKLVAKDKCNNKTVVNFSVIEDEPEETPVVITAEPNLDDPDETVSPEPTEDPNGGTVVIGGTSTPVATSATTTDAPTGTATPNVKTTASPAPTAKQTDKPGNATSTPKVTATPTVAPTEVPKKTYEVKVQVPQAWSSSTVYLYSYYLDSNDVKVEPNGTWANATVMTRDNSLSGYWYSANITLPQGQTAYVLVKNSNGQQRPEAQSQGYAVSGNTWVDLYGSVSSSKPSVVPTEVPATPTPATPTPLPDESQKLSADFKFEKQDSSSTVLLEKYIGTSKELTVQASYRLNGKTYKTVLPECTGQNGSIFTSNRTLEKITFEDGVRTTGNSLIRMFDGCMALKQINGMNELLRNNNIVNIVYMFRSCSKLEYGLGELVLPSTVIYTGYAFYGCSSLKYTAKLDGTPSMRVAESMYHNCSSLVSVSFDIPKSLENADFMFEGCSSLEHLPKNTVDSGLKTAVGMFSGCSSATDIVFYFKNLSLQSCRSMFMGCGKLGTSWVVFDLYGACPGSYIISFAGLNDIAKDNTTVRVESGYKSDWQKDLPSGFKVETM